MTTYSWDKFGSLQPSEDRAFQFSVHDLATDRSVTVDEFEVATQTDEIRFRGTSMAEYSDGQWKQTTSPRRNQRENVSRRLGNLRNTATYVIRVTQDEPVGPYAFYVRPTVRAVMTEGADSIRINSNTGALVFEHKNDTKRVAGPVSYEVYCCNQSQNVGQSSAWWLMDFGHVLQDRSSFLDELLKRYTFPSRPFVG